MAHYIKETQELTKFFRKLSKNLHQSLVPKIQLPIKSAEKSIRSYLEKPKKT